ncbi:MAG: 16S rRNA (guanine(527)-N(7))-methyltransferase RsmG [Proteobacteria bacterium]|nr:16S rRNA (guanine(527)-N(7))-methyltransferase RsmG [Pseudomonadota bacterium]
MTPGRLSADAAALGLELETDQCTALLAHLDLVQRWGRVYNLTALRDPAQMYGHHLLDCLVTVPALAVRVEPSARVLDVGSGAGFPGVVLAIARPDWQVCCIDAVAKKTSFIRQVAAELRLPNLHALHQRVETLASADFDLITSRAFASLADFTRLSRGARAPRGQWAAMKAKLTDAERAELPADVQVFHVEQLHVPGLAADRCLVWMRPDTDQPLTQPASS